MALGCHPESPFHGTTALNFSFGDKVPWKVLTETEQHREKYKSFLCETCGSVKELFIRESTNFLLTMPI